MDFKVRVVRGLCQQLKSMLSSDRVTWSDCTLMRSTLVQVEHGDERAWRELLRRLAANETLARCAWSLFVDEVFRLTRWWWEPHQGPFDMQRIAAAISATGDDRRAVELNLEMLEEEWRPEVVELLVAISDGFAENKPVVNPAPKRENLRSEIMYVERKEGLAGPARIGRVFFSKTGKTKYYGGRSIQSTKSGYKYNHFDVESGEAYWLSRCRKDGQDTLYSGVVAIDEDVRVMYWQAIRKRPDLAGQKSFRSEGKFRK